MHKCALRLFVAISCGILFCIATPTGNALAKLERGGDIAMEQASPTRTPLPTPTPAAPKPPKPSIKQSGRQPGKQTSPCTPGNAISLGILTGNDTDALAQTLSSVMPDLLPDLIVTAVEPTSSAGSDDKAPPKNTLCAKSRSGLTVIKADMTELAALVKVLDNDRFKGVGLNSNFLVPGKDLPQLQNVVPHPTPDLDLKDPLGTGQLYILVPSPLFLGQSSETLAQDAAKVKRDLLLLQAQVDITRHETVGDWVSWTASHTVLLEAITPSEAALVLHWAFPHRTDAGRPTPVLRDVLARSNNSVIVLPPKTNLHTPLLLQAQALERNALDAEQKSIEDALKSSSPAGAAKGKDSSSGAANTSTTSTIKTTITQASAKNPVTIATTTMPTASPASSNPGSGTSPSNSGSGNTSGGSGSGSGSGPGSSGGQASPPPNLTATNFQMDYIIRLYHLRDAAGIASAINTLSGGGPGARPLVQALSDNGTNDLLQILPPLPGQRDYARDVARAIALLDLPRPQVAMQVWAYQISAEAHRGGSDEARRISTKMGDAVKDANFRIRLALQNGMAKIYDAARGNQDFFDPAFQHYLTRKYEECIQDDKYCLGYYDALQVPAGDSSIARDASLGRLLLFIAAASDNEYSQTNLHKLILAGMNDPSPVFEAAPAFSAVCKPGSLSFDRFQQELETLVETSNLRALRAAFLDFFFQYKWTVNYPKDFVPYDLQQSAHRLDDLFQPLIQAFNDDIDDYVQDCLDTVTTDTNNKAGLSSFGTARVTALSGTPAVVSGQISNYFDITQTPALSTVAQALLGGSGSNSGGGGNSSSSSKSSGGGGSGSSGTTSTSSTGSSDSAGGNSSKSGNSGGSASKLAATVGNFFAANEVAAAVAAANIVSPQQVTTQLARGMSLSITPISLDTASSAELNVNLSVNEPDAPQSVDSQTAKHDLLNRVANHTVNTKVRVESLRLFDLSTFSMKISHPQTPTCLPSFDDGTWGKVGTVAVNIPFAPVCAVWRSVFGSMPVANRLFSWPQNPKQLDNRSVVVVRAVVVPTAMDLGLSLRFENDRVVDPVTNSKTTLTSIRQLDGRARPFHKQMLFCVVNGTDIEGNAVGCDALTLEGDKEDLRQR